MKEIKVSVGSVVKFRHNFLKGKDSLMVFKKTPSLCDNCFQKMNMHEADVAISPTKDFKKISVLLINIGFLWNSVDFLRYACNWNPEICNKLKALYCDACKKKRADWKFDHLNKDLLPALKKKKVDANAYFFLNSNFTHLDYERTFKIIDYFKIEYKDIINHNIWIINGKHLKKSSNCWYY